FRNKQNERFISGVTKVDKAKGTVVDLTDLIGKDSFADFKANSHTAVASLVEKDANASVRAEVDNGGKLTLYIDGAGDNRVGAWIIDTDVEEKVDGKPIT